MKVLVWAPAPWLTSAFARNGRAIALGLQRRGHNVSYLANYGLDGHIEYQGIPVWGHQPSFEIFDKLTVSLGIDHIIQHFDTWLLNGPVLKRSGMAAITSCYPPIESETVPAVTVEACQGCHVIAMTEMAQRAWNRAGVQATWIPHGVDPDIFHPVEAETRIELRRGLNIPDDALVFCLVATNNWRKNIGMQLQAFARVSRGLKARGKQAYLMLHTRLTEDLNNPAGASDLESLISRLKLWRQVRIPPQWALPFFPDEEVARIYQISDVNLLASCAEGFGLPVIEAGACGVPSIITAGGAQEEVLGDGGIAVKVATSFYRMAPLDSWAGYPSFNGLVKAMQTLSDDESRAVCSEAAMENAERYSQDIVSQYWDWYLQSKPLVKEIRQATARDMQELKGRQCE